MKQIGVARFTDETYGENQEWKYRKQHKGCVYGFDREISMTDFDCLNEIYTLDIRCSKNTKQSPPHIYGIGKIKCMTTPEWRSRIYTNEMFNWFVYKGTKYLSREELMINEKNQETIKGLENLLCSGPRHFKRGPRASRARCFFSEPRRHNTIFLQPLSRTC